jgi:sporulation protein YlmC with PRC-barrel domain
MKVSIIIVTLNAEKTIKRALISIANQTYKNIEIKGTRLLTNKGNFIGEISEYEIEEDTGEITRLHYKCANDESKVEIAEADRVLTFGVDVVVVKQNTNGTSENTPTLISNHDNDAAQISGADFFKRKQRIFLIGKKVLQDIQNAAGENLIAKGTVVTEEILNLAEHNGKIIELSQYAK